MNEVIKPTKPVEPWIYTEKGAIMFVGQALIYLADMVKYLLERPAGSR